MSEIYPCPCCGGEAKFQIFDKVCNIECQICFIGTRFESIDNAELVVETWNKRVKRYPESLAQRMIADGYEHELFELRKERDEIKAKHELPLDAVGTPIHVGDRVYWYAVGYFDVIGIGEQVVLDKGDSRFAIVPSDVLEVVATRFSDAFVAMPTDEIKICIEPGTELKEGSVIHIDDDGNMTLEA